MVESGHIAETMSAAAFEESTRSNGPDAPPASVRGRSLERFEESLRRLDPPRWMNRQASTTTTSHDYSSTSSTVGQRYVSPASAAASSQVDNDILSRAQSRPRYSEHRRSYSAHRSGSTSNSSSYWKTDCVPPRTPSSRGPSPGPGSRPATAGGRFHGSSFSRWSASTLCSDSAGYSNGNNTPTGSVVSGYSARSSLPGGDSGMYNPYGHQRHQLLTSHQKPYMGWRSQDNLMDGSAHSSKCTTPTERLAYSYRRAHMSGGGEGGPNNAYAASLSQSLPRNCLSEQYVHDSIRSVSSAIMEFCRAEDVPPPPPPARRRGRSKDTAAGHQRAKIVWLESSFVSSNTNPKSKL